MIAVCNDLHFWGLEQDPSNGEDQGVDDPDVLDYPCTDRLEEVWNDDSISKQLGLVECLQEWDPWAQPTQSLIDKFGMVCNTDGPLAHGGAIFKARQFAIYQLTREQDAYEELSSEKRYQKAEKALRSCSFLLTKSSRKFPAIAHMTRANYARACLKASQFIDMDCIKKQIESDCHTGKQPHGCLNIFRASPSIVRNFRILWASLPRVLRLEFLYKLVRETLRICLTYSTSIS